MEGMFSSAKHDALGLALVKVRRLWPCVLQLCVFLVSVEAEGCYVFWMVGICMIAKTSYHLNFWGPFVARK